MIKMYGFWRSIATFRVRVALNLKGLAYEEEMVDLLKGEQYAPGFRAINSQAALPAVIIDGGPVLTQSLAILEYLEEIHPSPPLLPDDALGRARVRSIALLLAADHHPLIVPRIRRYMSETMGLEDEVVTAWIVHWFREALVLAEARVAGDPATGAFCHGDAPTLADICLVGQAVVARGFRIDTAEFPTVHRITDACLAIDAFARAQPLRQPGAPAAFAH
jgi:maleylacetoacetate isomerase